MESRSQRARASLQRIKPDWAIVLSYEQKLRKEAMRRVLEGHTLADAMASVIKDADLKEAYFTTPVALKSASSDSHGNPSKYQRFNSKGFFWWQDLPLDTQKGKGKGKQKSKADWSFRWTFERAQSWHGGRRTGVSCVLHGTQVNAMAACGRVHQCRVKGCYSDHKAVEHKQKAGRLTARRCGDPQHALHRRWNPSHNMLPTLPVVKVLYLFAGRRRHSDVAAFLRQAEVRWKDQVGSQRI